MTHPGVPGRPDAPLTPRRPLALIAWPEAPGQPTGGRAPMPRRAWSTPTTGVASPEAAATDTTASQTLIAGASYGPANELLSITGASGGWGGESFAHNSIKQLTCLSTSSSCTGSTGVLDNYPSSANNGKIASQADGVSGETVTYTYDTLNRLQKAENQCAFSTPWGQSFTYDGFGNLTNTSIATGCSGYSAPTFSQTYDANNHAGTVDSNGNPASIYLPQYSASSAATWDVENRLTSTGGGTIFYSYAPGNRRVWKGSGTWTTQSSVGSGSCNTGQWSTDEVDFWGINGQKLMTYSLVESPSAYYSQCSFTANTPTTNYYFGAKLIKNAGGYVYSDRLGTIGKSYPYGIERPSATTNNTEKFTGYYRDLETGNDYAINRYVSPGFGRFFTPDPTQGSFANPADPGSWNMYAYTRGDPVNRKDSSGTDDGDCDGDICQLDGSDLGGSPFGGSPFGDTCLAFGGLFRPPAWDLTRVRKRSITARPAARKGRSARFPRPSRRPLQHSGFGRRDTRAAGPSSTPARPSSTRKRTREHLMLSKPNLSRRSPTPGTDHCPRRSAAELEAV